jgi:drug/metabolite transporter (DMT)-like permease
MLQACDRISGNKPCFPFWSILAPTLFILLWSSGFTALKVGLAYAEPITYLALRYAVVLAVLVPLFLIMRPPLPRSPVEWGHQMVIGILVQYAVGFAAVLPLAWILEDMQVSWTGAMVASLLYLAIGNSLVSVTLLLAMIRRGEASRVSALFFLGPPTAAVIAWLLISEAMPPLAWLGMALTAAGVAIANRRSSCARKV